MTPEHEEPRPVQPSIPINLTGGVEAPSLASTTTTAVSPFSAAPTSATSLVAPEKVKIRGRLRRLLFSMLLANVGLFAMWGAIPGILLPLQIQGIVGDESKAGTLAIVSTVGAFVAMIAQPIAGMVSDRTRSRFGRRAVWMVGGTLVGGLGLEFMGASNGIVQLAVAWIIVQVAYNFAQGPLSAILPDRVPSSVRGTFSAITGLGLMAGALIGTIAATQFANAVPAGYLTFGGIAILATVLFVVLNPDKSSKGEPREPFRLSTFLQTFWVSPRKHPDFFWGFTGRLLLYSSYYIVTNFQLYLLQDYIGLKDEAVNLVPVISLVSLAGVIIATLVGGPLSDKLGRRKIIVIVAGVIMAVAFVFPFVFPTVFGMLAFALLSGIGFGSYQSVDTALMSEVLPSKQDFAKDLGVLNMASTLPQTLAPAIAGLIVVLFGYAALFPIAIVVALVGSFAVLPIRSVR
jgi:MFS family permease